MLGLFFAGTETSGLLSLWNLYFLAGVAGFGMIDRIPPRLSPAVFGAGLGFFALYAGLSADIGQLADLEEDHQVLHLVLAPAFLALIVGAVLAERAYDIRYPRLLLFLGESSYSIYLVHSAAISAFVLTGLRLNLIERLSPGSFFWIACLGAVVCGLISYLAVEKPLTKLLSHRQI